MAAALGKKRNNVDERFRDRPSGLHVNVVLFVAPFRQATSLLSKKRLDYDIDVKPELICII
ncbi:hypothetical protein [uncultured Pseudoteredinibacter sp.]|uniref:hypothetical protein n=1 Tax=uncultured Pseudoteredinibacter sp. TaxID=1641701 RepID=UPI002613AAC1|nr:hypothetical protein [uncultured Pseudoteredinibacter sp.]